jgi:hypothetical protein
MLRSKRNIGWDIFMTGRLSKYFLTWVATHFRDMGSKLTGDEWATKMIMALWVYMDGMWAYWSNIYHEKNTKQVARSKIEELDTII